MKLTHEQLTELRRAFEDETDDELERKRGVYRSFVVKETLAEIYEDSLDLEANRQRLDVIAGLIKERQHAKGRREGLREWREWLGITGPFILGLVASPWLQRILGMD